MTSRQIIRNYYVLTLLTTLAASFIWGINTLFLLDAGLTNTEAFAANAFYTVGMVLFEIPTGVVADMRGRRMSFLMGSIILLLTTILYYWLWKIEASFMFWAGVSMLLGLGFTFFSGAIEAWVVDALRSTGYEGDLDAIFARNQMVNGFAMLSGSVAGGVVAQYSNLGVPYVIRSIVLLLSFAFAFWAMKDLGFKASTGTHVGKEMYRILQASLHYGWRQPTVQKVMLASPFTMGVLMFAFYAMQPYLLNLYGAESAYAVSGLAAAIVASAQMVGGFFVPFIIRRFKRRTSILLFCVSLSSVFLMIIGFVNDFYLAVITLVLWAMILSTMFPVRQALINRLIPSEQRATVLSFDSLIGSSGGVVSQPMLGRTADVWGYSVSYAISAVIQLIAIPFILKAKKTCNEADRIR